MSNQTDTPAELAASQETPDGYPAAPPPVAPNEAFGQAVQGTPSQIPRAVVPQFVPPETDLKDPRLYFNQELSWIDFNWRVLYLALDERTPLLERVRFVAITANNLDEHVQKRVGGLKRQEAAGVRELSPDGRTPGEQLEMLDGTMRLMHETMTAAWEQTLKPLLRAEVGVVIAEYADLSEAQREAMAAYFRAQIYPILTPLTVDVGHPFPFISNLSLSLAIILRHPQRDTDHFARLKVPTNVLRWIPVNDVAPDEATPGNPLVLLPVEQLIREHVGELFPGMEVLGAHLFRITRNADVLRDEEVAADLLEMISEELRERRFASVVRMEVEHAMPLADRRLLMREFGLEAEDVYDVDGLLDLTSCFGIADLPFPAYSYEHWEPVVPDRLMDEGETSATKDIFAIIRQGDLLVHHPYDSFAASVQRFIAEAAFDANVLAIKSTLYRTSDESPIVAALIQAAERGKQVAVLVEVKARFDEANNIEWGRRLESSGVHVAYGVVGYGSAALKTHTKATLIVRRDDDGVIRTYCHIGTGNYHPKTARLYTDLGLMTCRADLGYDMINLFHYLTGFAPEQEYRKVLVAPQKMRHIFYDLIDQEVANQERDGNGRIIVKMNAIDDVRMIRRLYRASQAGVKIDLIIRGHSRLRPGLPGYSENIRVISILGRFLEHDRIFYFHSGGDPQIYIGSADWRGRNLNARVELITPIEEPDLKAQLIGLLDDAMDDNRLAWELDADGYYILRHPGEDKERHFHDSLMKQALKRAKKAEKNRRV